MKKIKVLIISLAATLVGVTSFNSCANYLDVDQYFNDLLSLDSAFSKRIYVEAWLSNTYGHIDAEVAEFNGGFMYASDDIFTYNDGDKTDLSKKYQNGNYSASNQLNNNMYYKLYEVVRKASTFIHNVDKCDELTNIEKADYKGQARFIRAYSYWALIRQYGPVPLIPDEGLDISLSYEEMSVPRDHYDDIVNFIDQDLTLAATGLPQMRTANNMGHPTKGAALTLRARVLIHAASPLFNGNTDLYNVRDKKGNVLVAQEYDESKWARAAAAAKDVINLGVYELNIVEPTSVYASKVRPPAHSEYSFQDFPNGWRNVDPYASYKSIFDGNVQPSKNKELIFSRTSSGGKVADYVKKAVPKSISGGNEIGVSQKMVDAYHMKNGLDILDPASEYQSTGFTTANLDFVSTEVSYQYVDREPRFYASIAYSGSIWEAESASDAQYRNVQVFYYKNETDGKQGFKEEIPLSGIGFRKFYNSEDAYTTGGARVNKMEPTMRYAEVLLIYAEALNELTRNHEVQSYNGETLQISRDIEEIRYGVKRIRLRGGIPDLSASTYASQTQLRKAIKRERQIELVGENCMRYFDLRRWKDAEVEEAMPLMGCNINIKKDDPNLETV